MEIEIMTSETCQYCDVAKDIMEDIKKEMKEIKSVKTVDQGNYAEIVLKKIQSGTFPLDSILVVAGEKDFPMNLIKNEGQKVLDKFIEFLKVDDDGSIIFPAEIVDEAKEQVGELWLSTPTIFLVIDEDRYFVNDGLISLEDDQTSIDVDLSKQMIRDILQKYVEYDPPYVEKKLLAYQFDTIGKEECKDKKDEE